MDRHLFTLAINSATRMCTSPQLEKAYEISPAFSTP